MSAAAADQDRGLGGLGEQPARRHEQPRGRPGDDEEGEREEGAQRVRAAGAAPLGQQDDREVVAVAQAPPPAGRAGLGRHPGPAAQQRPAVQHEQDAPAGRGEGADAPGTAQEAPLGRPGPQRIVQEDDRGPHGRPQSGWRRTAARR